MLQLSNFQKITSIYLVQVDKIKLLFNGNLLEKNETEYISKLFDHTQVYKHK